LVVGVGVYFLMSDITDRQTMGLGFGVGAAGIVWYVTETYYVARRRGSERSISGASLGRLPGRIL